MARSWKQEFDAKYRKLMNSGDMELMDKANAVVLTGLDKLNRILMKSTAQKRPRRRPH